MFVFIEDRKEGMRETKEFSIKTRSWRRWHYTGSGSGSRAEVERARTMPIKQTLSVFFLFLSPLNPESPAFENSRVCSFCEQILFTHRITERIKKSS